MNTHELHEYTHAHTCIHNLNDNVICLNLHHNA